MLFESSTSTADRNNETPRLTVNRVLPFMSFYKHVKWRHAFVIGEVEHLCKEAEIFFLTLQYLLFGFGSKMSKLLAALNIFTCSLTKKKGFVKRGMHKVLWGLV